MAVGRIDVDEILHELDAQQLSEWQAFYHLEPFGRPKHEADLRRMAMLIMNAGMSQKKDKQPWREEDFVHLFSSSDLKKDRKQSVEEMFLAFKGLAARNK